MISMHLFLPFAHKGWPMAHLGMTLLAICLIAVFFLCGQSTFVLAGDTRPPTQTDQKPAEALQDIAPIIHYLLGITTDPSGCDINQDGNIDVADLIFRINNPPCDMTRYFPMKQGNEWTYKNRWLAYSEANVRYVTRRVMAPQTINGHECTVIKTADSSHTIYLSWIDNRLCLVRESWVSTLDGKDLSTTINCEQPLPLWNQQMRPGQSPIQASTHVTSSLKALGHSYSGAGDFDRTIACVAFEDVQVGAGDYPNAARLEVRDTGIFKVSGDDVTHHLDFTNRIWLAQDVGPVKILEPTWAEQTLENLTLLAPVALPQDEEAIAEVESMLFPGGLLVHFLPTLLDDLLNPID